MKKLVLVLVVVLVLSGIFAVAALTQVDMQRDITATVASDTDPNVAILFTVINEDVAYLTGDNKIVFDLSGALTSADYFNPEATFVIGEDGAGDGVFTITNNSNVGINVSVTQTNDYVELLDVDGATVADTGVDIAAVPDPVEFHFRLKTFNAMTGGVVDPGTSVDISEQLVITQQ